MTARQIDKDGSRGETLNEAMARFLAATPPEMLADEPMLARHLAGLLEEWMDHTWINAFTTVRPTDELKLEIGAGVLRNLASGRHQLSLLGIRGQAAYVRFNAS